MVSWKEEKETKQKKTRLLPLLVTFFPAHKQPDSSQKTGTLQKTVQI
jgi:hypothetical protein